MCLDYSVTCVLLDRYSAYFSILPFCRDCLARSCQRSKLELRDIFNSASLGILKSNDAFVKLTQVKHEEDGDYYPFRYFISRRLSNAYSGMMVIWRSALSACGSV